MEVTQGAPFESFGLSEATMRAIRNKHYQVSTPVQAGCIPPMLAGKDVIAKAPTGTGKTMAFGIPIIERIDRESEEVQAVILAPTRELAMQITDEMRDIAVCHEGVRLVCLYGGQPIGKQIDALKRRPQIVVATPGRLSDHMKRRTVSLKSVRTVVLDEADRMLDLGFIHDVTRILDKIPSRQNLGMFSATISREVMDISWVYQRDPEEITVQATKENKPDILQYRLEVPSDGKVDAIAKILAHESYDRVICFCNTKGSTERLTKFLQMRGVDAQCIHGDIPQRKREEVMQRFRDGKLRVFVATDVASRGIDVDDVDAVFNYEVPEENEYYIHRIGRTGRAKRHGVAYTLLSDFPSRMRLDDIARIELGAETYTGSSRNNGEDSVNMAVYRLDDANALEAMNGVKDTLVKLQERFPDGVSYVVSYDPTQYISATMAEIVETLIIALILVVGITYVFLQDWRATLIPALAIPVSLIGTFAILLPLGFSINVLTMFGLILVIGSLVDDGIIVVENTMRILETEDLTPEEATKKSMHQITGAAGDGGHLRAHRLFRRHGGEHLHAVLRDHVRGPLPFRHQFLDAQPRPVRAAAEEEEKEAEQVQPLPPLQRHAGMGAQELYQVRRHHGAPRLAHADSAGRRAARQLEAV